MRAPGPLAGFLLVEQFVAGPGDLSLRVHLLPFCPKQILISLNAWLSPIFCSVTDTVGEFAVYARPEV